MVPNVCLHNTTTSCELTNKGAGYIPTWWITQ